MKGKIDLGRIIIQYWSQRWNDVVCFIQITLKMNKIKPHHLVVDAAQYEMVYIKPYPQTCYFLRFPISNVPRGASLSWRCLLLFHANLDSVDSHKLYTLSPILFQKLRPQTRTYVPAITLKRCRPIGVSLHHIFLDFTSRMLITTILLITKGLSSKSFKNSFETNQCNSLRCFSNYFVI